MELCGYTAGEALIFITDAVDRTSRAPEEFVAIIRSVGYRTLARSASA